MNKLKNQLHTYKALYFLIVLSVFLVFPRLGENALGVDEGVDSFYSLTTLKFGYPANSDGINEVDYFMAIDGRQKVQPWFPYYVRALSIYIFGQNSFAARFPSALIAVLSVPLLYFLTLKINRNKEEAAIATLLFICSVPLLLYFRTARYIAFQIPFTLLILWFYFQMLEHRKWGVSGFILSSALLFHSMHIVCAGVLAGIILHLLLYERNKERVKQFFIPFLIIFFLTAPWILYTYPAYGKISKHYWVSVTGIPHKYDILSLTKRFFSFLFQINNYIFPLIFLFFVSKKFYKKDFLLKHRELVLIAIVILTTIGISTLHYTPQQHYIAAILPLFYIFTAHIIFQLISLQKSRLMIVALVLLIFTNVIHVGPLFAFKGLDYLFRNKITKSLKNTEYFRGPISTFNWQVELKSVFSQYLYEITHQYRGPLNGIVEYVKNHGGKDDTFLMNHEFGSFAFHTNMRRIYGIPFPEPPDWIILRKNSPIRAVLKITLENIAETKKKENFYRNYIFDYIKNNNYQKIVLDYPARRGNNVFEIQIHKFKTPESDSKVVIYRYLGSKSFTPRPLIVTN
tara:strand:- start:9159 stop:10868 length:1710 start_codon:yes stop_codon:yes gene_type:complete